MNVNMKMNMVWTAVLGIAMGVATHRTLAASDKATDFEAEQKQIEKEDAEQEAEREKGISGKYQRVFQGTVYLLNQANNEELSPGVVGNFMTNLKDKRPGRNYLLKLVEDNQGLADQLRKLNGKPAKLRGNLRVIGENGEAKYLIVDSIVDEGPTQKVPERRSASGL